MFTLPPDDSLVAPISGGSAGAGAPSRPGATTLLDGAGAFTPEGAVAIPFTPDVLGFIPPLGMPAAPAPTPPLGAGPEYCSGCARTLPAASVAAPALPPLSVAPSAPSFALTTAPAAATASKFPWWALLLVLLGLLLIASSAGKGR